MDDDLEEASVRVHLSAPRRTTTGGGGSSGGGGCVTRVFCNRAGLLVLVAGYALMGALLFKTLEGGGLDSPAQGLSAPEIQKSREACLRELWLITERLNVLYEKNWTKLVTEQLESFERAVVDSGRASASTAAGTQWTFGGALLYSLTLLTTIGYGRLSPRTALGKIAAIFYALIGVPLMLVLLSALGSLLAGGCRRIYSKLCCKHKVPKSSHSHSVVGYHKASAGAMSTYNHTCKSHHDDCAAIQITSAQNNCHNNKHMMEYQDHLEPPKKTILATVRTTHARGRCRQMQVRQMLADPQLCPTHSTHSTPTRNAIGFLTGTADIEEDEEENEQEHGMCAHDTPSRVPLICRQQEAADSLGSPTQRSLSSTTLRRAAPTVPATLVLLIFVGYVCLGAFVFAATSGWTFLDAAYFCFIALTTIGLGDRLPQNPEMNAQLQLYACCAYLFLGLVVVAMCFSLVHDELAARCRQFAVNVRLVKK